MSKNITVGDFLTNEEIEKVQTIWRDDRNGFHKRVLEEIIQPNMDRINRDLGQENNPDFLAYLLEYVMGRVGP